MKKKYFKIEVVQNGKYFALTINDKLVAGQGVSGFWNTIHSFQVRQSIIKEFLKLR